MPTPEQTTPAAVETMKVRVKNYEYSQNGTLLKMEKACIATGDFVRNSPFPDAGSLESDLNESKMLTSSA
jgi:hypothetical protein